MDSTQRLRLPLLSAGQAQKEIVHNEALQLIDVMLAGAVEEVPRAAPPSVPQVGQCFIVGSAPSGEWTGYADHLAAYTAGGWRHVPPVEGMSVFVRSIQADAAYRGGSWQIGLLRGSALHVDGQQVVGARQSAIAAPAGGAVVDNEARLAIGAMLAALRAHGLIS